MKTSEILRRAKRNLSPTGVNTGICAAVSDTWVSYQHKDRVNDMIAARIYPWMHAPSWLGHVMSGGGSVDVRDGNFPAQLKKAINWSLKQSPKAIQAWRHAWVDSMIAEFEAKGD